MNWYIIYYMEIKVLKSNISASALRLSWCTSDSSSTWTNKLKIISIIMMNWLIMTSS